MAKGGNHGKRTAWVILLFQEKVNEELRPFLILFIGGKKKMGIYEWKGSWARWEIREIEYLLKCAKDGTRTEEEVWKRFQEVMRGEKSKD